MAFARTERHLLKARDLADARYFEPLSVDDLADRRSTCFDESRIGFDFDLLCHLADLHHDIDCRCAADLEHDSGLDE